MTVKTGAEPIENEGQPAADSASSVNRLAIGAGVSLAGTVLGRGIDFAKQVAMARLLGPDAFGLYAIGWNALRILEVLAPLGLHNGVVHFGAAFWRKDDGAFRSILTRTIVFSFVIGWAITFALIVAAPWVTAEVFKEPEFLPLFRAFALMLPFMGALRVAANATRISHDMKYSVAAEQIAQAVSNLILFVVLYLLGWRLLGAIVSTVLSFAVALILAIYYVRRLFAPAFAQRPKRAVSNRELFAYSLPTAMAGMFGVVINRVDRLFLGYYWPSDEVGIYQAAAQISVILVLILNAFNMILMPMIAEQFRQGDMGHLEELYRVNTKWGVYSVLPVVLVIAFAAEDVMTVLFGAEYAAGSFALTVLTIGQFINIATGAAGTILIMTGHQNSWFRLSVLILVVNLTLNLSLIPRWGMNGAAVATSTTVGGLFAVGLIIVHRLLRIWPYDRRYLKGLLAAAATAVLLAVIRLLGLSPFWNLVFSTTLSFAAFYGLLVWFGLDEEDKSFIGLIRRRVRAQ